MTEQKPVGKFAKFTDGIWREVTDGSAGIPLYTAPQQWVGLTDEEIEAFDTWHDNREEEVGWVNPSEIVAHIEAKLKEKNNGK